MDNGTGDRVDGDSGAELDQCPSEEQTQVEQHDGPAPRRQVRKQLCADCQDLQRTGTWCGGCDTVQIVKKGWVAYLDTGTTMSVRARCERTAKETAETAARQVAGRPIRVLFVEGSPDRDDDFPYADVPEVIDPT